MIFDAHEFEHKLRLQADVCIVGCGAGGSMVAMIAAEAGLRVVVLEAGQFVTPKQMTQREDEMFPKLLWDSGGRTTNDRAVRIHQGKGVGGSTLHNLNLCKRIPPGIFRQWREQHALESFGEVEYSKLCEEVETLLGVSAIPAAQRSRHNRLLEAACANLNWRGGGLNHNRTRCLGSGFCQLGCSYDAKNNACKVLIPRAVKAGAEVITSCEAVEVLHDGLQVRGVAAVAVDPVSKNAGFRIEVRAPIVCLSASATATAALLLRSGVPDRSDRTGQNLHIHPAAIVAGDFDEPVDAFNGIPQSFECTEFFEGTRAEAKRTWIIPAFAQPMGFATMLPGHGDAHAEIMARYRHLAVFTAMLHDRTTGTIRPTGDRGLKIDYWPNEPDRKDLAFGAWACAHLLFAAGANRVLIPGKSAHVIERGQPYEFLRHMELRRGQVPITAVHPMSSVPMGDDPGRAPIRSDGRHHQVVGLYVADGSLFPTSIGVPPQISIYAMGLHVGRAIVQAV